MGNTKSYENYKEEVIFIKSKIVRILGIMITLICLLFIAKMILSVDVDLSIIDNKGKVYSVVFVLACLGSGCLYLVAYGWSILVKFIEPKDIKNSRLTSIYIKANIAKYLPGNVMNLVGRNVLASKLGFKQISIATSTVIEIIIFGCTTMMLAFLFSITKLNDMYNILQKHINYKFIGITVILVILLLIGMVLYMTNSKKQCIKKYFTRSFLKLTIKLVFLYSIYFIFLGVMLVIILSNILNLSIDFVGFFQIVGFYIISYFIGYVTPGSPGGMGVRETVLILLLITVTGSDLATVASIIHRFITIVADIIIYGINYLYIRRE